MSWFKALKPDSLRDLFVHEMKCVYDMEEKQLDALAQLADAATDMELKSQFEQHRIETQEQLRRLEGICQRMGLEVESDTNASARGLAADVKVATSMKGDDATRDAALIMVAQSAEHLEISRYGTMRTWARILGLEDVAELLQRSLDEETAFDKRLTALAESAINIEATH